MAAKKGGKKEKVFHPKSRKAGQLERSKMRKEKIVESREKRAKRTSSNTDKFTFFYHAIPPRAADGSISTLALFELHDLVRDVWLARHDYALGEEAKSRRKGRPKSVREVNLENMKASEAEEYRTGLEVPDLTHPTNVELFLRWDQQSIEFIDLLRFIRINSEDLSSVVVTRPGKHESLRRANKQEQEQEQDMTMDT